APLPVPHRRAGPGRRRGPRHLRALARLQPAGQLRHPGAGRRCLRPGRSPGSGHPGQALSAASREDDRGRGGQGDKVRGDGASHLVTLSPSHLLTFKRGCAVEALLLLLLGLTMVTLVGHGIWVALASLWRSASGEVERGPRRERRGRCPACWAWLGEWE